MCSFHFTRWRVFGPNRTMKLQILTVSLEGSAPADIEQSSVVRILTIPLESLPFRSLAERCGLPRLPCCFRFLSSLFHDESSSVFPGCGLSGSFWIAFRGVDSGIKKPGSLFKRIPAPGPKVSGAYVTAAPGGDPHVISTRIIMAKRPVVANWIVCLRNVFPSFRHSGKRAL